MTVGRGHSGMENALRDLTHGQGEGFVVSRGQSGMENALDDPEMY